MTAPPPRWVGAPPQIVFEDAHIRVMFKPGGSDMLLLTFGNAQNLAHGMRFYADTLVGRFGINCVGFMAHAPNFFPAPSMRAAAEALSYTLSAFAIRMAYGSSLGAYAAIKHSALLGVTHIVAFCPQWSIDPAECGAQDSGFRDLYRPEMAGMGIRPADMAGDITIFYDPGAPSDAYHTRTICGLAERAAACRVRPCHVHHVGHHVAPVLRGSALTAALLGACYRGETARLYTLIGPARRASAERRRGVMVAAAGRHPAQALAAARQLAGAGQLAILDGTDCLARLWRALHAAAGPAGGRALADVLAQRTSPVRARLLASGEALAGADGGTLRSVHGTVLCYSALCGCLVHVAWPPGPHEAPGLCPVFPDAAGRLAARIGGQDYLCRSIDHLLTDLVPAAADPPPVGFVARPAGGGAFTLMAADRYLTALPDGTVYRLEPQASKWEVFVPDQPAAEASPAAGANARR
jgi:hypothetical protein